MSCLSDVDALAIMLSILLFTVTTPSPTTIKVVPTTPPSGQSTCVNGWSDWLNRNSPDVSGTGDVEKMTASELTSFCPGGTISQVECQTADGIPSYSSGEILTCTTDGGLVCSNADNFPIPCTDYQIKYQCTCPGQFRFCQQPQLSV